MTYEQITHLLESESYDLLNEAIDRGELIIHEGSILLKGDYDNYIALKAESEYLDRLQGALKILLNSVYGALLNQYFRFFDPRFGQSVTLSGRVITKHMAKRANEVTFGEYDLGEDVIYADTDSCYLSMEKLVQGQNFSIDKIVNIADDICTQINTSFEDFCQKSFLVKPEDTKVIACKRETVAKAGLFSPGVKKRYVLGVVDSEGKRVQELKCMGIETERSDTPTHVQLFLESLLDKVVFENWTQSQINELVVDFRKNLANEEIRHLGKPTKVSKIKIGMQELKKFDENQRRGPKPRINFAVMAAISFNTYRDYHKDYGLPEIFDGDKILVFNLLPDPVKNPFLFPTIGLSTNLTLVPEWFSELPFDLVTSQSKLVTKKVENIFSMLGWTFQPKKDASDEVFG